ncbi:MAG: RNA-binding S4 domain-containing protein [Prevotellaceae bacterium]|jgi:23S rRNA pseudouridine2605 synthase|nr:RNA-binding S4 domain-containing protein [Prevotellaceae bacterium]
MSTENDNWRSAFASDEEDAGNRFEGENHFARPSHNREEGDRPQRPRFNNNGEQRPRFNNSGEQRPYNNDRPNRPRFTNNDGNGDYHQRPRYNNQGGDRPYNNNQGDRPYRPRYNNNQGGGQYNNDRPQRPRFNNNQGGGQYNNDRPYRPRYNNDGQDGGGYQQRPRYNNQGGGQYNNDRPYRPRYNNDGQGGGGYQQRPRFNNQGGGGYQQRPRFNNQGGGHQGGFGRPQRRTGDYDPNAKYSKKKQIEYKEQFVDPNEPIRLNKYLANAGVCSRREADEFIAAGVVSVNGVVVTELGTKITRNDEVKFHEQPVSIERKIYIILNKPKDCVTTSDDPRARRTVMDLVKGACPERIYPVGRLDRNTTGVLLLTNDGDLASKLTHPQYMKKKVYQVQLDKNVTAADMEKIATGITLDDGEIKADAINYADEVKRNVVGIEIHSGKNRIVRRIFESLGYKVMKLDRVLFAGLTKKGLRRGEWRFLTQEEVNFLNMGSFE